jgi:hypothetical protein
MPNGHDNDGCTLHFGYVFFIFVPGVLIWLFLGWRRLWLVLPWVAAVWLFFFALSLIEDRWRAVTPDDIAKGVPPGCPECGNERDIIRKKSGYTVRCPICGFKDTGVW